MNSSSAIVNNSVWQYLAEGGIAGYPDGLHGASVEFLAALIEESQFDHHTVLDIVNYWIRCLYFLDTIDRLATCW